MNAGKIKILVKYFLVFMCGCIFVVCLNAATNISRRYGRLEAGGKLPENYIVNGIDVSGENISDAINIIENDLGRRQVELCGFNTDINEFTDINVEFKTKDISIWSYIINKGSHDAVVSYEVDKEKLRDIVGGFEHKKSEDARISFKKGKAVIIPEVYGNVLKVTDEMVEEIEKALQDKTEPDLESFYEKPDVTSEDLKEDLEKAKKWDNYKLKVTTDGSDVKTFDLSSRLAWNGKRVVISGKWIEKKVKQLAGKLNTYGKTRKFVTNDGKKIKVPGELWAGCLIMKKR